MSEFALELATGGQGPEVDATPGLPLGTGHVANMAHLVQQPDGMAPAGARLVTDDVRILHNGWRIPGRLPVSATEARPVKHFQATFTPKHFTAEVEFAWRDLTPNPHRGFGPAWDPPTLEADGTIHVGSRPGLAPLPLKYGGYLLILATPDSATVGNVPSFGHQLPSTCRGYRWYNGAWGGTLNLSDLWSVYDPSEHMPVDPDQYYFVTFYWTNESGSTGGSPPDDSMMWDVGTHGPRWSFPHTVPRYITG